MFIKIRVESLSRPASIGIQRSELLSVHVISWVIRAAKPLTGNESPRQLKSVTHFTPDQHHIISKTRQSTIMKLTVATLITILASTTAAKNVFDLSGLKAELSSGKKKRDLPGDQAPLFQEPPSNIPIYIPEGEEPQRGPTLLTSGINTNRAISVFAGYVRDDVAVSQLCNDRKKQTVVFAPSDAGIETLNLKPWQFPTPVDDSKSEEEIAATIASNADDFVKSHMIDGTVPFEALDSDNQKGALLETLNGKRIKLVNDDGDYYVNAVDGSNEWLKVESVTNVDNGAILVIDKPLVVAALV
ncbi:CYFA0S03e01486g1_1 [Cyberlindnera fabianii]|uniref:CYFA0S03e01486g1_1 n=2 Tax=Cyberlindnera fabianii TaxID=36022 RepID=A0A061ANR7_CYBFA|nr:CYFA0S03e01486g1_1 [Cyberlindnera fabianii]